MLKTIHVHGAHNHDWEDIACGPCDDDRGHCICVGRWNPHQQDCETLMVDPHGNLYVITKVSDGRGNVGMIDRSTWDNSTTQVVVNNLINLPLSTGNDDPTGGDISPNGREILIQTHHQIFYWQVDDGTSIKGTFLQNPIGVPFHYVKHGQSVAWDVNGRGYYTVSEGHNENLYYYARQ